MNQQPDKFFRDKLEHFQKPISANAWSRVEKNLDGKKTPFLFWKVAAVITLLVGSGWWVMSGYNNDATKQAESQRTNQKQIKKNIILPSRVAPEEEKPLAEVKPESRAKVARAKKDNVSTDQPTIEKEVEKVQLPSENTPVVAEQKESPINVDNEEVNAVAVQNTATLKSNTLILSADEVNAKYLNQENLETQATPENKKPSTLQRLLNKMSDLKNNQDPLGELRQKKDEILALNFKTEKQRNQNR